MSQREHLKAFLQHEEHLRMLAESGEDGFMKEFMALKQQSTRYKTEKTFSTAEGENEINIRKNRYKDILPFDYTRFSLPELEDVEGSDYINANYITDVHGKKVYIAAQGPLPHTVVDFWRMLWESGVEVVIMACNEYEGGKHKCEKYWAEENERKQFGEITVTLIRQLGVTPDFLIRTLKVNNQVEERVINQFHYTAWPDHGVPKTVQPIMDMIKLFREYLPNEDHPVVMHCSAGCGRTGTMICIDFVRAQIKAGKIGADFCLYDIIKEMRRQRPAIVQTRDQYELVHRAVAWLFRKELGLPPNPKDFGHLYENVKLQAEGPRLPPGAANSLSPEIKPQPCKLSPKQRRHKDMKDKDDSGHNYVNHSIAGKGLPVDGRSSPPAAKVLKPPSLPTKQQRDADSNETIYANVQDKVTLEEKAADVSSPLTPKQSPLAQERFESGYKTTLAAFKDFEIPPVPQARSAPPKSADQVKPSSPFKLAGRTVQISKSFDDQGDPPKPLRSSKPMLSEKPQMSEKPVKVLPVARPNIPTKPAIGKKKETDNQPGRVSGLRRRPTSEPVNGNAEEQGKVPHLGTAQFQQAKNLIQATLLTKPESDSGKDKDPKKGKDGRDSKGGPRPTSAPPKPPVAVIKPIPTNKTTKSQTYEEVGDLGKSFPCQVQPVSMVKLQSHKDKVESKNAGKQDSNPSQMQRRKTMEGYRPKQSVPDNGNSEYSYATQPKSVIEKLKEAQSRPQLRTGLAQTYASAYADPTEEGNPKELPKSPGSSQGSDYSYACGVQIPITPGKGRENVKKFSIDRSDPSRSSAVSAYEVIEVGGLAGQRSVEQEESPVFDKNISYDSQGTQPTSPGQPRESILSGSSWASFTDSEFDCTDDEKPPEVPVKTSASFEYHDGEEGDDHESGSGGRSKPKLSQFILNQRDKLATHKEKIESRTKGFFVKIGDVVNRSSSNPSSGTRSSPPSTLSTSPQQAALVSDLNEIIKKTLREYEPTYKDGPTMFNNCDISFPKRVQKPKSPPPVPTSWIKSETHSTTVQL
ncbi:uncharacterized protein LOC117307256 isoform X1 [Asterias rubens]|uniref:uncharacterized protein LOC117307256 isoform X1 n=1 Tax=Asterias rubens TaxID=7604 RepID=UPI00145536C6|nr:uncharacterized protein LOC117307256 isoform X1 [Asterias rubens]